MERTKLLFKTAAAATAAKLLQLCLTLCNPIDGSPPGSPVPGILQARTLWNGLPFPSPKEEKRLFKASSLVFDALYLGQMENKTVRGS